DYPAQGAGGDVRSRSTETTTAPAASIPGARSASTAIALSEVDHQDDEEYARTAEDTAARREVALAAANRTGRTRRFLWRCGGVALVSDRRDICVVRVGDVLGIIILLKFMHEILALDASL